MTNKHECSSEFLCFVFCFSGVTKQIVKTEIYRGLEDNGVFMLFESSVNKTINISLFTELDKLLMVTELRERE